MTVSSQVVPGVAERLHFDNFTPPQRTPWGGHKICAQLKKDLVQPGDPPQVGESWEFSVEPSFPSRLIESDRLLLKAIAEDPIGWLGDHGAAQNCGQTPLLVKLLDAADNLSLQVHPAPGDPRLPPGSSGKPEGWVVLAAEPGSGLYLGFKPGVSVGDVRACLTQGGALDALMNFVEVSAGDAFIIAAGTPHAVGRGVMLIEPQSVTPGARGVTYRFWDWNRRYDAQGQLDPNGQPRELHLERSLEVTSFQALREAPLSETCRFVPQPDPQEEWEFERARVLACDAFVMESWRGTGQRTFAPFGRLLTLTCVEGQARLESAQGGLTLRKGESAVVPAKEGEFTLFLYRGLIYATRTA